jgi:hypothetical protein
VMPGAHLGLHLASVVAWRSHHSQRIHLKAFTGEVGGAQSGTWCWIEIPSSTVMDPGFSQLNDTYKGINTPFIALFADLEIMQILSAITRLNHSWRHMRPFLSWPSFGNE